VRGSTTEHVLFFTNADKTFLLHPSLRRLVVVAFLAPPVCRASRDFEPALARLAAAGRAAPRVLRVLEADSGDALAARGVQAFPTLQLYVAGARVFEQVAPSEEELAAAVKAHAPPPGAAAAAAAAPPSSSASMSSSSAAAAAAPAGLTVGGGGGGGAQSADDVRAARLRALGLGAGAGAGGGGGVVSAAQRANAAKADPAAVETLMGFGFTQRQAQTALSQPGNAGNKDVELAVNWLADNDSALGGGSGGGAGGAGSGSGSGSSSSGGAMAVEGAEGEETAEMDSGLGEAARAQAIVSRLQAQGKTERQIVAALNAAGIQASMDASDFRDAPMTAEERDAAGGGSGGGGGGGGGGAGGAPKVPMTKEELEAKVRAMRAAKAAKAKEEARLAELKRREDGKSKNDVQDEVAALMRKSDAARAQASREFDAREKARLQLEMLKDKAEREAKSAPDGKASAETLAKIKLLVDGKPLPPALSPRELVAGIVRGLSMQTVGGAGRACADVLRKLLDAVAASPGEAKFRKIKLSSKAMAERVLPAAGGKKLLTVVGFVAEEDAEAGSVLRLPDEAVDLELIRFAVAEIDGLIKQGKM